MIKLGHMHRILNYSSRLCYEWRGAQPFLEHPLSRTHSLCLCICKRVLFYLF